MSDFDRPIKKKSAAARAMNATPAITMPAIAPELSAAFEEVTAAAAVVDAAKILEVLEGVGLEVDEAEEEELVTRG